MKQKLFTDRRVPGDDVEAVGGAVQPAVFVRIGQVEYVRLVENDVANDEFAVGDRHLVARLGRRLVGESRSGQESDNQQGQGSVAHRRFAWHGYILVVIGRHLRDICKT